jgi:hypothetical protein
LFHIRRRDSVFASSIKGFTMKRIVPFLSVSLACALGVAPLAFAEAPVPSDPSGNAGGGLPGAYPLTVTGANVNASPGVNSTIGGGGSDDLLVSFPSAGPLKWTDSRHNEGDIALLISPFDPNDPSYYPPNSHINYKPLADGQPFANTTLAWRVNQFRGALLASVRHNGVNNGDNYNGSPVGSIHGTAYFNNNFGQGWGFNANTGEFANGGNGSSDLQLGIAGSDDGLGEAVFNTATAYFPYEQGWTGAWVSRSNGVDGPGAFSGFSPDLTDPSTVVNWTNSMAMVTLPGVNSATDGMLFVAPADGDSNSSDIAAAFPTAGGWKVAVREDEDADTSGNSINFFNNEFQFLYVPYTAGGLVGGHINGNTGAAIKSAGDVQFDLTRTSEGQYAVSVYNADGVTKKNGDAGMLILSVAGTIPTDGTLPDRTFLSYQYDAGSGNFIVQSREVASLSGGTENVFGNDLALRDSDFYFAWVDFANPLTPTAPIAGDFDDDGDVDGTDLGLWKGAFGQTAVGDADNDGDSDGADFLVWQRNYAPGAATGAAAAVPEPAAAALAALGAAALLAVRKRQS